MSPRHLTGPAACLWLIACAAPIAVQAPTPGDFSADLIHLNQPGPPPGPPGTCWASDITPAVFETITEQTQITPEVRDATGTVTAPASYRSVSRLKMLRDHAEVWFKAPCPAAITPDFIATLQRALKARGFYLLPLTGALDEATLEAIRRYQAAHGLDSPVLSLAATRDLGIVATALADLK